MGNLSSENFQPHQTQNSIKELTQHQALFNAFFAAAQTGMVIFDDELRYRHINETLAEVNGLTVADHIGKPLREVLPEIAPTLQPILQGVLDTGKALIDSELVGETPKQPGVTRYWLCSYYPLFDDSGAVFGLGGLVIEITDRKKAEQALKASEERLKLELQERTQVEAALRLSQASFAGIVEIAEDAIITINSSQKITLFNQGAEKIFGYTAAEVIGQPLGLLMPAKFDSVHHQQVVNFDQFANKSRQMGSRREILGRRKNGVEFPAEVSISQLKLQGEKIFTAILRDISDRKQIEVTLRDNEARLRQFVEFTPIAIAMLDEDLRYVAVSHQWLKEFNLNDIIGRSHYEVFPDIPENWKQLHQRCLTGLIEKREEESFPRADGSVMWLRWGIYPWYKATGEIGGIIMYSENITHRKQTEIALQQSEERFRSLMTATAQIIWNTNADGELITEQPSWGAFTGQAFEEYKGLGWLSTIHPDDRSDVNTKWSVAVANRSLYEVEFRMRRFDGEYRYMSCRAVPILHTDGTIREWMGTCTDIHDRKLAEMAVQLSEERYRSLITATSQIIWTTDPEGRVTTDMPEWRNFTGRTLAATLDFGWLDATHPEDQEPTGQAWNKAVETQSVFEAEYRLRAKDGSYRYFVSRGVPILNQDGNIREWIGTCTDIHDRKMAEIAIAQAKDAAEMASRAKSEFLANMSHELRTPLNGILGYAQVLQRSRILNPEDRSRIDVIYQCGSHLLTLINDILDLSKIEAQKVELIPIDFHFPAFLQGVAEMCRVRAELKGIQFNYQLASELPIGVHADEKRLRQVLINLLSNAIKFTDEGSVTFTISYASEEKVRFEVRDTGTGIANEQLLAIFQPFEQVGDVRRQTEGTGLGLAISQKIVELMDSKIQVQSEIGVGSIFWFDVSLPQATEWVKTSQTDRHGQIIGIKGSSLKVVVIDDKWENRSVVNNLLTPIGFDVYEAINGHEGWEKVLEIQPDLVITDLLMPKADGFELIKRIRQSQEFKDLVIIVSSASVFEADQYKSLEAGGNDFLPKPLQAKELLAKVQKHLNLEWIYEEIDAPVDAVLDNLELVAPPVAELETLYELAMKGNFKGIIKQATLLESQNQKYIPFAKKLHQLAKEFQDEKIVAFIQFYK